jgi:hypothetical protein
MESLNNFRQDLLNSGESVEEDTKSYRAPNIGKTNMRADAQGLFHPNGQERQLNDTYQNMAKYHHEKLHTQSIFLVRPMDLQQFFTRENMLEPYNEGERRESLIVHEKLGLTAGLLKKLATDARTGIIGDDRDLARRRHHFGANIRTLPPTSRFWSDLVWKNLCQRLILVLVILSAVTLVIALLGQEPWAWVEPLCILAVIAFTVLATSMFDYAQE